MTEMCITRAFSFESSHKLINSDLSDAENKKIYGKCYDCISHGHSYKLLVTVCGSKDENGMIVNFKDLSDMCNELIINGVDHKYLNEEVPYLKGKPTTCENIVTEFWTILDEYLTERRSNMFLQKLQLWETSSSSVILEVNNADRAWLAGLIDGEGTITINKCNTGGRMKKYLLYNGRVSIANTKKALLDAITNKFFLFHLRHYGSGPAATVQLLSKPSIKKILIYVYPYLVLKRRHAEILMEYCNSNKVSGERSKVLYDEIHELNKHHQGDWESKTASAQFGDIRVQKE